MKVNRSQKSGDSSLNKRREPAKTAVSGAMGTVRSSPEQSEGPTGRRWNCPRGLAVEQNKQSFAQTVERVVFSPVLRRDFFLGVLF
ncbi:MAG: hypothetical protein Q7J85_07215 [Bacillota bacterium]|nr:hypothetical protein [Bacillota bacterium]